MKHSFQYLIIAILIHVSILALLWFIRMNNSILKEKKEVRIELFGDPDKPYGIESKGQAGIKIKKISTLKSAEKKFFSALKDDFLATHSADSLVDTNKTNLKSDDSKVFSESDDSASGGALFAYGSGQLAELPSFAGGGIDKFREWMLYNIHLSSIADQKKITGTILITFIVNVDGEVTNVKIQKGINPDIDNEAIRIVKSSPRWTPGKQQGQPVRIIYKLPLIFSM